MKKTEFFSELKKNLAHIPADVREDFLGDIEEHFSAAASEGMSEEEICKKLGTPSDIAVQVAEEYSAGKEAMAQIERKFGGGEIEIDEEFSGITDFDIDLTEADIKLMKSPDSRARVKIKGYSRHKKITVEKDGSTLVVKSVRPFLRFSIFQSVRNTLEAKIYVPAGFTGDVKAVSTAGNIKSENISGNLEIKTAAGNITVDSHAGRKISLSSAAGNVKVELTEFAEYVKISSAAGDVKLTAQDIGELKLDTAAGNAKAKVEKIGRTKISTAAGNAELTATEIAGDVKISTAAGNAKVYLPVDVNCRIDAQKPALGSLKNEIVGNPNSSYTLKATSALGSIKLLAT